jgi:hypothetical protein
MTNDEQDIQDIEDFKRTDFTIEQYANNAIMKAQNSLSDPDLKQGLIRYRLYIENLEITLKTKMDEDEIKTYDDLVKKFIDEEESRKDNRDNEFVKGSRISNFKLSLLYKRLFMNTTINAKIRV